MNSHRYTHLRTPKTNNRRAELDDFATTMRLALFKSRKDSKKIQEIKSTALDLGTMYDDFAGKSHGSERKLYREQRDAFFDLSISQDEEIRQKAINIALVLAILFLANLTKNLTKIAREGCQK